MEREPESQVSVNGIPTDARLEIDALYYVRKFLSVATKEDVAEFLAQFRAKTASNDVEAIAKALEKSYGLDGGAE